MAMPATKVLPEQVQIVEAALSNNNMTRSDVTPQAFCVLLEQARRYASELIADAQDYAICASRSEIAKADLELASQMRPDHPTAVTTQLPKLNLLAQQINRIPLPPIPTQCYSGVLLPPKRHQLTARTYDVVSGAQVAQRMVQPKPSIATKRSSSASVKAMSKPSYGAARGRQISIALKEKEQEKKDIPTSAPPVSAAPPSTGSTGGSSTSAPVTGPAPMEISSPVSTAAPPISSPAPASADPPAPAPGATSAAAPAPPASEPVLAAPPPVAAPVPVPAPSGPPPPSQANPDFQR
jgi:histone H3/H4